MLASLNHFHANVFFKKPMDRRVSDVPVSVARARKDDGNLPKCNRVGEDHPPPR